MLHIAAIRNICIKRDQGESALGELLGKKLQLLGAAAIVGIDRVSIDRKQLRSGIPNSPVTLR